MGCGNDAQFPTLVDIWLLIGMRVVRYKFK